MCGYLFTHTVIGPTLKKIITVYKVFSTYVYICVVIDIGGVADAACTYRRQ